MSQILPAASVPATALLAALALCFPAPSQTQDELFVEDFEDAILCNWSAATESQEGCVSCSGQPDGTPCSPTVTTQCGGCTFDSACDEVADQECTCLTYACSAGACRATSGSCMQQCTRNADGTTCGAQGCPGGFQFLCCGAGTCSVVCSACQGAGLQDLTDVKAPGLDGLRCAAARPPEASSALAALLASPGAGPSNR